MKVKDIKSMLTNFTTGGNDFEVNFIYESHENEDGTHRKCVFNGMNVYPGNKLVVINLKEQIEVKE